MKIQAQDCFKQHLLQVFYFIMVYALLCKVIVSHLGIMKQSQAQRLDTVAICREVITVGQVKIEVKNPSRSFCTPWSMSEILLRRKQPRIDRSARPQSLILLSLKQYYDHIENRNIISQKFQ